MNPDRAKLLVQLEAAVRKMMHIKPGQNYNSAGREDVLGVIAAIDAIDAPPPPRTGGLAPGDMAIIVQRLHPGPPPVLVESRKIVSAAMLDTTLLNDVMPRAAAQDEALRGLVHFVRRHLAINSPATLKELHAAYSTVTKEPEA